MCSAAVSEREVRDLYRRITLLLIDRKLTITTMESCTSGLIASLITDTEGASAVMKGAFITYSNEAKILRGVPADTIGRFGVYSAETAEAMAEACLAAYPSDLGIGVTGTMGNVDPANQDSTPGTAFFAMRFRDRTVSRRISIPPQETRYAYKLAVAGEVGAVLLSMIS